MIKIHILFRFSEGAWGGGNQFLKALRKYFQEKKAYTENPRKADVVLFNSNKGSLLTLVKKLCQLKFKYKKVLINRIDGPIHLRNVGAHFFDELIIRINSLLMDGCVFQSNWAFKKMKEIGEGQNCMSKIIHNAPDKNIFYPSSLKQRNNQKIKIIATSWSHNYYAKGFDIYDFLDENLDFSKYVMTFVGRSPIQFKHIKYIESVPPKELAELLRQHDIYITASVNDPCSNALLEAQQCGLPAIVRNSGGHPELVKDGGVIFNNQEDVLKKIDKLADNLKFYENHVPVHDIDNIGDVYLSFI